MKMSFILTLIIVCNNAYASLKISTSNQDLANIVRKISGKRQKVSALFKGKENLNDLKKISLYIKNLSNSDIFFSQDFTYENDIITKILKHSKNQNIQRGQKGLCIISIKDKNIDDKNSNFLLAPDLYIKAANKVLDCLIRNSPTKSKEYLSNYTKLENDILKTKNYISNLLKDLRIKTFVQYDSRFSYFLNQYQLNNMGSIKSNDHIKKNHLSELTKKIKDKKIKAILATEDSSMTLLEKFTKMTGIPFIILPSGIVSEDQKGPKTFEKLQLNIVKSILKLK